MKISRIIVLSALLLMCGLTAAYAADPDSIVFENERGLIDWSENYIEATGMGVPSKKSEGAQGKLLARRSAIVDLQRNLLEFLNGVQIDSRTVMDDFMAEDRVRSEVHGVIKNVDILKEDWDGELYTVSGRVKLAQLRAIIAPSLHVDKAIIAKEKKQPTAKSSGKHTGLIIDVRHLPLVPAMTFRVFDENRRAVYGMEFVSQASFLESGICSYYNNINYAKGELHVAPNPISTKALKLTTGNVDIVIPNSAASMVRGSSYDFRKECKVIIIVK
jgi:hypothetical protein